MFICLYNYIFLNYFYLIKQQLQNKNKTIITK